MTDEEETDMTTRIAQVGLKGFGRIHLNRIDAMVEQGRAELVATADPAGPAEDRDVAWYPTLTELLANHDVDVVSIATPIGTHRDLACEAMDAGAAVMLEKPPVPYLEDFWHLLRHEKETNSTVQIGFQSFGSQGIARMRKLYQDKALGDGARLCVRGCWLRDKAYYNRSGWAGKRVVNGKRVADGVATNPLAHSIATALLIADVTDLNQITSIDTEMYHAHDIQADDTTFIHIGCEHAKPISVALTLCGHEQVDPSISLIGPNGEAKYFYTADRLELDISGVHSVEHFERTDLLENLIDHLDNGTPLLVPLASTASFMAVLEATQARPDPIAIPEEFIDWKGEGDKAHPVIDNIEYWLDESLRTGKGFVGSGAPWGDRAAINRWELRHDLCTLNIDDREVAEYSDGTDMMALSSPRPYLHPIRTLRGVRISDSHPADHDWHCGLSLTMQDVNGVNFWGGRTYVRDQGYQWLGDQGRIEHADWLDGEEGQRLHERLVWTGPWTSDETTEPTVEVTEDRQLAWEWVKPYSWVLDAEFVLMSNGHKIMLGGPGTNGRTDAGYGGYQLRLADCTDVNVRSSDGDIGADNIMGTSAHWVAWSAQFAQGPATVIMARTKDASDNDRWFVRNGEWNGIGIALAWDRPAPLPLTRHYQLIVVDGIHNDDEVRDLVRRSSLMF